MVPRAYLYAAPHRIGSLIENEKDTAMISESRRLKGEGTKVGRREPATRPTKPMRMCTVPPAAPSKPMVIPTRSQGTRIRSEGGSRTKTQTVRDEDSKPHSPRNVAPSIAVLLASTSIPSSKQKSGHKGGYGHALRAPSLRMIEGLEADGFRPSVSSSSVESWDILHNPPTELDSDKWSLCTDSTLAHISSLRSPSNDSIPSLDIEFESPSSTGSPLTPGKFGSRRERRPRASASWQAKDCGLDHPLLPSAKDIDLDRKPSPGDIDSLAPDANMPMASSRSSFKSNLTASFEVLRTAARSFSNFTAPVIQREDFLTRSMLSISPQFTDERRPRPSKVVPDPAVRRYLNPTTFSPSELHIHYDHERGRNAQDRCTTSIQLQTYQRGARSSEKATSPPIFISSPEKALETETSTEVFSSARQREPRENSDFLRVIVMEMNMRKAGKLNDAAPGKARIWLPPRQIAKQHDAEALGVPRRWSGIVT